MPAVRNAAGILLDKIDGMESEARKQDAMVLWLARELAKWELAADGVIVTPAIIDDRARRCIEAARRETAKEGR